VADVAPIELNSVGGIACPYTASWLAHTALYQKARFSTSTLKMEEAFFSLISRTEHTFQLSDSHLYYINHMSAFEHSVMRHRGYDIAESLTHAYSTAAAQGECTELNVSVRPNFIALIPFYSGRPPGVSKDLKVHSIGQGNSLVNATTKALQCIATVCSSLKYFGRVVIGVSSSGDEDILQNMIGMYSNIAPFVAIKQFNVPKPATLPFYLLAWGQLFVRQNNCMYASQSKVSLPIELRGLCDQSTQLKHSRAKYGSLLFPFPRLITHVYYTEADQTVHFNNSGVFDATVAASNSSVLLVGFRKEKHWTTTPDDYLMGLHSTRASCGRNGFILVWPNTSFIYSQNTSEISHPTPINARYDKVKKRQLPRSRLQNAAIQKLQQKNTLERLSAATNNAFY